MAWRPNKEFIEGVLDNTTPGKVAGWMRFAGMENTVVFDLDGDFDGDIRGQKIHLEGKGEMADPKRAAEYMAAFSPTQKGTVGVMTAGKIPITGCPYFEWYSEANGRVVLELEHYQVKFLDQVQA